MTIGFTGTRQGMSRAQRLQFERVLEWLGARDCVVHHGDAVGADSEADQIAHERGVPVVAHPATPGGALARNREIVAAVDIVVAAPRLDREERRSGTWATVRYALAAGKPVVLLARDSTCVDGYLRWLELQMQDIAKAAGDGR